MLPPKQIKGDNLPDMLNGMLELLNWMQQLVCAAIIQARNEEALSPEKLSKKKARKKTKPYIRKKK